MTRNKSSDVASHHLFAAWCAAEYEAHRALHEAQDDMTDPRYVEAEAQAKKALHAFLCKPTSSLYGILLKLKVACQFDDYVAEAVDPACSLVSPRAIVAAMSDLENIVISCFGAPGRKQQDTPPPADQPQSDAAPLNDAA